MATLDEIRAKILEQENKNQTKSTGGGGDNSYYAFWNTPEGGQTTLRFLPDANPDNVFFWVEKLHINLPFNGVKNGDHNPVVVRVPCMEMYEGGKCPILAEIRPWWKDATLAETARKYWKKKSYMFQGFVVNSGFEEENTPENPIRKFSVSPGIFDKIKAGLIDKDFEDNPTDYIGGRNFRLKKTKKGQYANYDTSNWVPKVEALTMDQLKAIEEYGLNDLSSLLPRKPTDEEIDIIFQMFQDSVDEKAYDAEKYGQYFKPFGVSLPSTGSSINNSPRLKESTPEVGSKEEVTTSSSDDSSTGEDIASIIARVNASRNRS